MSSTSFTSTLAISQCLVQDVDYLYLGIYNGLDPSGPTPPDPNAQIIKVRKSDLAEIARTTFTSDSNETMCQLYVGRGWNSGTLWLLVGYWSSAGPPYFGNCHLLAFDATTLSQTASVQLTYQSGYGDDPGTGQLLLNAWEMAIDATGDIYLCGVVPTDNLFPATLPPMYPTRICKMTSSLSVSTLKDFPNSPDPDYVSGAYVIHYNMLLWDDTENALTLLASYTDYPAPDTDTHFVKMDSAGTTLTTRTVSGGGTYGFANRAFLYSRPFVGNVILHTDIASFAGQRSYFLVYDYAASTQQELWQINPADLSTIQTIPLPTGYANSTAASPKVDSNGSLWTYSSSSTSSPASSLFVYGDNLQLPLDEKIFAYGMTAGLGRGWA